MFNVFRVPAYVLIALSITFGGGTWATTRILKATSGFGAITVGPWSAYPDVQTADADPYARAHRAEDGRLLFGRAEGLVFSATADSEGNSLAGNCVYLVSGQAPPARFWTLRVTDRAGRPIPSRPNTPASVQSWLLLQDVLGYFEINVGGSPQPGNWISMSAKRPVRLVLTLIDTPTAASVGLGEVVVPTIKQVRCDDT